jgi:hypothetical protein
VSKVSRTILFREGQDDWLREMADELRCTVSALVRGILDDWVLRQVGTDTAEAPE